jgi:polyhydroxyalkanoate synthesis repressor PhaR
LTVVAAAQQYPPQHEDSGLETPEPMERTNERKRRQRRPNSETADGKQTVVIKKYANRRLYNTASSSYVTLDHLCRMVKDDVDFAVYDAKTGEDITRPVLTQIIVEEESKGTNLLPITFLRQLISFYGDSMQWVVPKYLEHMMSAFAQNQERMRQSMQDTLGTMFPFGNLEEMSKQNLALFESAMKMFSPFARESTAGSKEDEAGKSSAESAQDTEGATSKPENAAGLEQLRRQIDDLQKQIEALSKSREEK